MRKKRTGPRGIRHSDELPDGVGTLFVTNVPGSPIQAIGRRSPGGELCFTAYFTPRIEMWPGNAGALIDAEVVTGPEAARLIISVRAMVTERAEAEGLTLEQYLARSRTSREVREVP